jgi:subtilase family serine protease
MTIAFKLPDSQQADLQRLLANQQDRSSPDYHHWLSPNEYADQFGLSLKDVAQVRAWLESGGFRVDYVPPSRNFLVFSGTAQQVQAAFATEIHFYQVDGESHFANATDLSVPSDLSPLVTGVQGLDDFYPKPASRQIRVVPEYMDPSTGTFSSRMITPSSMTDTAVFGRVRWHGTENRHRGQTYYRLFRCGAVPDEIRAPSQ